jgi:alpha-galactosidase
VFSICEWGENRPWEWASDTGHLWRTTGDISDNWGSMLSIMKSNLALNQFAGPGHWNDPDMLEVGNGGMTDTEYRSHFSLWSIMAAPLPIGSDLRSASQATLTFLTNSDVIAVDQDRQGVQGKEVKASGGLHVIVKPLANGEKAVALFNENGSAATISTNLVEVGLGAGAYTVKDLWSKAISTTSSAISASVPAHGTVLYRLSRVNAPTAPPSGLSTLSDLTELRSTNGWGPFEHNRSNGEQGASDGAALRLQGVTYAKGLGTHAFGEVEYYLGGRCSRVTASVGVDDEAGDRGSVVFQVFADSALVADSGTMTGAAATKALTATVSGATTLRLVVTNAGDGIDYDHADWADAKVTCA